MPKSNKQNLDTPSLFGDVEPPPLRLRKAHEAIFIRPQEGSRLPLIVRKVFNLMLKHAQDVGIAHAEYEIPFRAMVKQLEYKSNDYDLLKNHLRELQRTQVEWDTLTEKGKRKWGVTSLVMYAKIEEGKIMYAFQEDIKTQLLNPSIYLDLDLNKQNAFRKPSSLAFYEMCGRYATNPTHLTARLHWKEWRDLLCREEAALYDEYKYFNARVLKPAIAEVNALSDIEVKQVAKKEGREQVELQFEVRLKSANKSVLHETSGFNTELYKKLVALGVNATRARKALSEYDHSRIEATIDLVAKRARTPNLPRISSMSAYFLDALRNGYVPATEPKAERQALANAATIKKAKRIFVPHSKPFACMTPNGYILNLIATSEHGSWRNLSPTSVRPTKAHRR